MAYYRLYHMRGTTEHVELFDEFEAPNDDLAIDRAERTRGPNPMELWSNHRKVKRWDGPGEPSLRKNGAPAVSEMGGKQTSALPLRGGIQCGLIPSRDAAMRVPQLGGR